jgi:hypothetical protein
MNREAFEKWVCNLNRAPTAWEGWQAALQHAGQAQAELVEIGGERYLGFNESEFKAIPTGTKFYTLPHTAVPEWVEGQPEIDKIAVLHIPLRGYPEHCLIGYVTEYGDVFDMCGDCTGCAMEDVSRWADISFLLSAANEK